MWDRGHMRDKVLGTQGHGDTGSWGRGEAQGPQGCGGPGAEDKGTAQLVPTPTQLLPHPERGDTATLSSVPTVPQFPLEPCREGEAEPIPEEASAAEGGPGSTLNPFIAFFPGGRRGRQLKKEGGTRYISTDEPGRGRGQTLSLSAGGEARVGGPEGSRGWKGKQKGGGLTLTPPCEPQSAQRAPP